MYKIIQNTKISPYHYLISVAQGHSIQPRPGQFYMLLCSPCTDPLLRRPFSVHGYHPKSWGDMCTVDFLFRVAGSGTTLLSRMREADQIELFGPLGRGFEIPQSIEYALFIAGGIGIAPLPYLAESLAAKKGVQSARLIFGANTAEHILVLERFENLQFDITIYTEDGSMGTKGCVTDHLDEALDHCRNRRSMVFACGPTGMLAKVAQKCISNEIPCQVSMDQRMACGVGACLGCVVRGSGADNIYKRVCKDGPVFQAQEILWSTDNKD